MKKLLENKILEFDHYSLTVGNLVSFFVFLGIIILLSAIFKRIIYRSKKLDSAKKFSVNQLTKYILVALTVIIGLKILGFNVSVLLAGSAALLVGVGLGLQNLFNDFVSGIILLLDQTLKVGDIIEVNSMIYKVQEINFRTSTVMGRDESYIILPNSELTGNKVINWTHGQTASRFKVSVGVDYSTDIFILMPILKATVIAHPKVLNDPEPFVRFEDYGDSSLNFSVYFFTDDIFGAEYIKSEIRVEIFKAFKAHNINIPFPQRVVHMAKN